MTNLRQATSRSLTDDQKRAWSTDMFCNDCNLSFSIHKHLPWRRFYSFFLQQEQLNRTKHANGAERDETPTPVRMLRDEREAYDRKDEESRALAEQLDAFKEAHDKKEEDLKNLAEQMEEMNQMMEEQQKLLEDQHSKLKEQENLINEREDRMKELEKLLEESKEDTANKEEYDRALKGNHLFDI